MADNSQDDYGLRECRIGLRQSLGISQSNLALLMNR